MGIFEKNKAADSSFKRVYQYANGEYLPDSSQPNPNGNWVITSSLYTPHGSTRYINVVGGTGEGMPDGSEKNNVLPELYKTREDCCGCTACYAICPVKAIAMRPCEEGFLYPVVDAAKCLRCHKCMEVCPIKAKDNGK